MTRADVTKAVKPVVYDTPSPNERAQKAQRAQKDDARRQAKEQERDDARQTEVKFYRCSTTFTASSLLRS